VTHSRGSRLATVVLPVRGCVRDRSIGSICGSAGESRNAIESWRSLGQVPVLSVRLNLKGKSVPERAKAMISIAHPDFRDDLEREAREHGLVPKAFA
jgi:hypothetical protein